MALAELAPAKVNLSLAVLGRRRDGYHTLDSLVAFAGLADRLSFAPGKPLGLREYGEHVARVLTDPAYEDATALGFRGETGIEVLDA